MTTNRRFFCEKGCDFVCRNTLFARSGGVSYDWAGALKNQLHANAACAVQGEGGRRWLGVPMTGSSEKGTGMRILLVEDDAAIVKALTSLLESEGYETASAARQDDAVALVAAERFDLVLLDIALAQGSGFAVCAAVREAAPSTPVIFLTAADDEYSTVAGLDMGAVDYIAKPFRARELLSRIRAALRRSGGAEARTLSLGDVEIDPASAAVRKAGREVALSALEYRLLLHFAQNAGRLVTRENLRDVIWDSAGELVSDNVINVYMRRLRAKIEDDPSDPRIITTVRGLGYKAGE